MTYSDYLKTPHWQSTKERYFSAYPKECRLCRSKKNIHLHHRRYNGKYGNILFIERLADLIALCGSCHSQWHAIYGHRFMTIYTERFIKELFWVGFNMKAAMQLSTNEDLSRRIIKNFKRVNKIEKTTNILTLDPNRAYRLLGMQTVQL